MKALAYAAALLLAASPTLADDLLALSTTATSITGDISFDDHEIVFENGKKLVFEDLIADNFIVGGKKVPASVYSVKGTANPKLLNGNRLCGESPVTYLASWLDDDVTMIAVFETQDAPESDEDMCALYTYVYP
ncbi:hypothetical protein NBH19_04695 [Rhizobium sp. S95]|uniref:Uncharacterized protein n=1 Tax=Ciceribacter sichuanensis TaxID=2949647 RepID=A0AAJ1F5I9_9HYPH|nr:MULTISPECIES: hypothetical protein [unclassified Ciceribacter]MCM2395385.1 hypothetical protein [Ciceribacter sp. S95]MCO5955807.1 hypothetical protein [Ciceribacter sp. S101]